MEFQGCLIIVTHDRYFMDKLVDHLFVFEGEGKIKDFIGNYNDYRFKVKEVTTAQKTIAKNEKSVVKSFDSTKEDKNSKSKTKFSYKEKLEFEQLEKDLELLEVKKEELGKLLNETIADHEELMKITKEFGKVTQELDTKTDRWLELSEFA